METTQQMTFTHRNATHIVTAASRPGDRGLDYLQAEYEKCGWTHSIAAKRPNGKREYLFLARIEGDRVVMVSPLG